LRAIRPDDRERLAAAFLALEPESVYLRYFSYKHELTPADLDRLCVPDFRERVVLVATIGNADGEVIIGSGGYVVHPVADGARAAEVAFAVEEDFHGNGIATRLLAVLADIARADGIAQFDAEVLARNAAMLQVFARSGLPMEREAEEDGVVRVTLRLA
jgi:RimJ/RimL family protein N-acetyltransferase